MTNYTELEEVPQGRPPSSPDNTDATSQLLLYYWRLLREYYWIILLALAVCLTGMYFWTKKQKKVYAASSKIVYHNNSGNVLGRHVEQVDLLDPGGRWQFEQFWNTQKQVFKSRWFAKRVVENLGLTDHPTFLPEPPEGEERTEEQAFKAAVGKVLQSMSIRLSRESRVGVVTIRLSDRELTSKIANAVADTYIDYTKEFQSGGLKNITNWFDSYVATKKKELESAQTELQKFKRKNNILSLSYDDRRNLTAKNIETVNAELLGTETKLASASSLLRQVKQLSDQERYGAVVRLSSDESVSASVSTLFERKAQLEEELAGLKTKYADKHPKVQSATTKLEVVNKNIKNEIEQIRSSIENRVEMLRQQKKGLQSRLATLKEKVFNLNELGVKFNQLKNKKKNLEELYNTVLKRSSELNINSLYQPQEIQILERAETPQSPVAPSMPMNLAIGGLLGLLLGAGSTFLLDALDTTVKTKEDIQQFTDKPILAMLSKLETSVLRGVETIGESPADTITYTAPKSSFAEGIKTLRTNLTFMAPDEPPELILTTSPGPRQGKTLTTVNTAIAMAQSGQKTLIIDTDIRKPRIHKALGMSNDTGVTTVVKGDASVSDVIQSTQIENLSVITSGDIPPNPSEVLHSDRFKDFVETVRERFDRIVFDSPPLRAVSDALILSRSVDGVLLVVEFGNTRKESLQRSLEQLREIGAPLLGTIFNQVPSSGSYQYKYYRYSYYGEGDAMDDARQKLAG